jgi:hypothetical protein
MTGKRMAPATLPAALLLVLALAVGAPVALQAAGASSSGAAAPADPVVAQVLQMLHGGVAEPVILRWLEKTGKRPAAVTSDDLVALHKVGASNDLQTRLIELSQGAAEAAPSESGSAAGRPAAGGTAPAAPRPSAAPAAAPPAPAPAPAAPGPATAAPPTAPAPAAAGTAPAAGNPTMVKVNLAVTYRPIFLEDEMPWTLYIYVDGRFLVAVTPNSLPLPLPARRYDVELPPGRHQLRVAQERHVSFTAVRGYQSVSRVDPTELAFELQPGKGAEIDLRFGDTSIRHSGPVSLVVKEDGSEASHLEPAGRDSETWPALCEDVSANLPAGKMPRAARRELDHCLHWADLWPGVAGLPSRAEVMADIERHAHPASAAR